MTTDLQRPWLERPAPTHPLVAELADSKALIAVEGPDELLGIVFAAYKTFCDGREWDPEGGTTSLDSRTVQAAAALGQLIGQAGAADYGHDIQPGPVYYFGASAIGLDLRFGDPDADWRALEAIACGFEALGCALNPSASASVTTRAS
jgi:hypothetical protein